jgi:hypothetical protein
MLEGSQDACYIDVKTRDKCVARENDYVDALRSRARCLTGGEENGLWTLSGECRGEEQRERDCAGRHHPISRVTGERRYRGFLYSHQPAATSAGNTR